MFTFLVGAGFSATAGLSSVTHLIASLEKYKQDRTAPLAKVFDDTVEISLSDRNMSAPALTEYYFNLMADVLPLPQARHDFITAAIQWASARRVQMNVEGILMASLLMGGTGANISLAPHKKDRHWMASAFARHVFTTNFDEVMPNTFYFGNQPVEIVDSANSRRVTSAAEYPTVVYLHGRHLHYDIRNTKHELKKRVDAQSGPVSCAIVSRSPAASAVLLT